MNDELEQRIITAANELQIKGPRADIDNAQQLFEAALQAYKADKTDPAAEYSWRMASLIYGAVLAAKGKWTKALGAYRRNNIARGGQGRITPLPPTSYIAFAAMMSLGEAVARVRSKNHFADEAASEAVRWFAMLNDARYNQWHGAALLIMAQGDEKATQLAEYARGLLYPYEQPELYVLANHLTGKGDGTVRVSRFRRRPATLQARECLYLFNLPIRPRT